MKIKINSVYVEDKGNYSQLNVKAETDNGRVVEKRVVSFNNKEVFNVLRAASEGQFYDVTADDTKYRNWIKIAPLDNAEFTSSGKASSAAPGGKPARSNFETPEERAERQKYIIRQSSLSNAVSLLTLQGNKKTDVAEVIAVAEMFFDYVINGSGVLGAPFADKQAPAADAKDVANMDDDIPF